MTADRVLSLGELNRALLARQFLLARAESGVVPAIERLAGLQAQFPPSPYVALWSRLAGFEHDDLRTPLDRRQVVKATLMRATLHLVSAREYAAYALATREGRMRAWRPPGALSGAALERVQTRVFRFAERAARTREEIAAFIAEEAPRDQQARRWLTWAVIAGGALIWEPAGAHFEHRRSARYLAAPAALRGRTEEGDAYDLVVRRYLGAFGPASVADLASWSGSRVPPLRAALERRKDLRRFRDEQGRELFDLADAPRPDADTDAPVRYLARFDAALLGYAAPARTRILPEAYRRAVIHAAEVEPTFLVSGLVAGIWRTAIRPGAAFLDLKPFGRLPRGTRAALIDEGERLVRFLAPESRGHGVRG
ncbi:MAG: winged helix DNA-binding domain-containing protein [bacterium]